MERERLSRPDRRTLLRYGLASGAGLMAGPLFARSGMPPAPDDAKARAVIHIFLGGGLSHHDTFDPKPHAPVEIRGDFRTVKSKLDGEPFADTLRRTATIADKLCLIRSMTHGEAAHERGTHNMLTGYRPSPAITYPSMGSVFAHELGSRKSLPPYVCVPNANNPYLGTGYLSSAYGPFAVGSEPRSSGFKVRDLNSPRGLDDARRSRRRRFLEMIDHEFAPAESADAVRSLEAFYDQAYELIGSDSARSAFDIKKEKPNVRNSYGMTNIGQRLLLARRLVEGGVRWISVLDGGYDNHRNIVPTLRSRMNQLDLAYSALIKDLDERGLLDSTLVVLTSEFGRTPRMNRDRGRDHWPKVFSVVLAGGGTKRGVIHGRSDATGAEPEDDPVTPPDLAATIFHLAGINPEHKLISPGDRPIDIVRDGIIQKDLIA